MPVLPKAYFEKERRDLFKYHVDLRAGASTLSKNDWRNRLGEWRINSDRHELGHPYLKISWLCPELDSAAKAIQDYQTISITSDQYRMGERVCQSMSSHFDNEDKRLKTFVDALNHFVNQAIVLTQKSEGERATLVCSGNYAIYSNNGPDGYTVHDGHAIILALEAKKEKGQSGDPEVQITFDYAKLAKRMYEAKVLGGYFPCLLLCLDGSQFSIGLGAVYHEITTQFFTSRISMGTTATSITQCTQALLALNECLEILRRYYNTISTAPYSFLHSSFPQIQPFRISPLLHEEVAIELTCRVSMSKLVFGGIGKENSLMYGQPFCIKYALNNYSIALHKLLASSNLAPKLHYSKKLVSGDTLVIMTWVTDVLPNESLSQLPLEVKLQVSNKLRDVLCLMKENNFVHGDLREPNIVVSWTEGKSEPLVNIIDFDFSGEQNVARYPPCLDLQLFPWLDENSSEVRFEDDSEAVKHYIRNILLIKDQGSIEKRLFGSDPGASETDDLARSLEGTVKLESK